MASLQKKLILILLCLALLVSGCAAPQSSPVTKQEALNSEASCLDDGGEELPSCPECGAEEPVKVRRRRYRAYRWAAFGVIVAALVIIDILLLPGYHRRHNCFPCTRTVIIWCG